MNPQKIRKKNPVTFFINQLAEEQSNNNAPIIDVIPPDGNKGDGLIHEGSYQLFKKHELKYNRIPWRNGEQADNNFKKSSNNFNTLIILGSGAFSRNYYRGVEMLQTASAIYDFVFAFPSTYDTSFLPVRSMVTKIPKNMVLFCRERKSYGNLKKLSPHPGNIYLDHDTALSLDYTPWKKKGKGVLYAFRNDGESPNYKLPKENIDVSKGKAKDWRMLLDDISGYSEVHTNRAHGMIASAMLGKETHVYNSNYFKQLAIYKHSLQHLPNVHFHKKYIW
jgi:exopolysaccharide biosynthesis predicted pyruvyltransferase EpsI